MIGWRRLPNSFGSRLSAVFQQSGRLCVGIDPHEELLDKWGLEDTAQSLDTFGRRVVDACESRVGIIKPQVAFYERHGSAGFAALERLAAYASEAKLLVIMDAKRGDIGSTMNGYFDAWLGKNAPFAADALTVSPYLGFDSLLPTLSLAHERGKGVFVLAATSNPEAAALQTASVNGVSLANSIWHSLDRTNRAVDGDLLGSFGAVIGATLNFANFGLELGDAPTTPILAPGFGAQGALLAQAKQIFGEASSRTIATVSRSVLNSGPHGLEQAIDASKRELEMQTSEASTDE